MEEHVLVAFVQILFTSAAAMAAGLVYLIDVQLQAHNVHDRDRILKLFRVPYATWMIILACVFPTIRVCGYLVDFLVRGIELLFARVDNVHYVLIGTSRGLRCAVQCLRAHASEIESCCTFLMLASPAARTPLRACADANVLGAVRCSGKCSCWRGINFLHGYAGC